MSDVRHYARAREHLENDMTEASFDGATMNALLAVSTAQRETTAEVRNGLRDLNYRLRDLKSEPPDANLVWLHDAEADAPLALNPSHVVAVYTSKNCVAVETTTQIFEVTGDLNSVVGKLGVSV